ncbi:MAG: FeoB-associated Cys-rich membrane protein [Christensenella sp.]|nr:FeoB-associated Cys-rich membrane protein [Christensenella sp.]
MLEWFAQNGSTLLTGAVIAGVVVFLIIKLVRDKRRGKSGCSCGCKSCSGTCHSNMEK